MSEAPGASPDPDRARPQRLLIVSGSTGRFHSRAQRYARTCATRGHAVTILAQWRPGLPVDERDAFGVRTIRPPTRTIDGLPLGRTVRRVAERFGLRVGRGPRADAWAMPGSAAADGTAAARRDPSGRRWGRLGRGVGWLIGRARLPLSMRATRIAAMASAPVADVQMGMSFAAIPVALALAGRDGGRAIYDIGDVYLEARNLARIRGPLRWFIARSERGWARRSDLLLTANEPYADLLERRLRAGRPQVILNTPPRWDPPPDRPRRFHERLGLPADTAVVLFHGGLVEERGIEQLVDAMPAVPGAVLILMGYGSLVPELERRVARPPSAGRVHLLPPVEPDELLDWVASADVVAMPIQPTTLNHRYTTPNRLWEAIAAGVPVLAGDLPGMAPIVRELDGGRLVDPTVPAAIAAGLRELLGLSPDAREAMRGRLLAAAHARYCWEVEERRFLDLLGELTGRAW